MSNPNTYPAVAFNFNVKFNGAGITAEGGFQEVSGLEAELGVQEVKAGGGGNTLYRLPLPATYKNISLKRGVIAGTSLREWVRKAIFDFEFTPVNVAIILLNEKQKPILRWIIYNAWPVKWTVDSLHSQENKIAVETFELAYDRIDVKT